MFALRTIAPSGVVYNQFLGEKFRIVTKQMAPSEFQWEAKMYNACQSPDSTFAFVCADDITIPLSNSDDMSYYIVMSNGQTYERINYQKPVQQLVSDPSNVKV